MFCFCQSLSLRKSCWRFLQRCGSFAGSRTLSSQTLTAKPPALSVWLKISDLFNKKKNIILLHAVESYSFVIISMDQTSLNCLWNYGRYWSKFSLSFCFRIVSWAASWATLLLDSIKRTLDLTNVRLLVWSCLRTRAKTNMEDLGIKLKTGSLTGLTGIKLKTGQQDSFPFWQLVMFISCIFVFCLVKWG